jgi:hypothetical protein
VYITPLFTEEFHVIARPQIRTLTDLAGKPVNLGEADGAAAVLGREVLNRLGIRITEVNVDLTAAIDSMRGGQLSASVLISGKPVKWLGTLPSAEGFHLLAIPYSPALQDFLPSSLDHGDYPNLVDGGRAIDTISVRSVLMAYNWPTRSERFRLLESLVSTLFSRLSEFQTAPHHPKWREINLAITLSPWRRFPPAERWVEQNQVLGAELRSEFERFLNQNGYSNSAPVELQRIFQEFLRWRRRHGGS